MSMFEALSAPFPPDKISWRVGTSNKKKRQRETGDNNAKATKGQVLAYLDARDVMDRLDEVCSPGGWQNRYSHAEKKTVCEIGILCDGQWVWKADGAGDSDIEAEKGALSDAFKRSAVRWGIGRYLYHLPTPWVDLDDREQIPQNERARLEQLLHRAAPAPATETRPREAAPPESAAEYLPVQGRKSSAQAKRDGDHIRINAIIDAATVAQLDEFEENFAQITTDQPISWLDPYRNRIALRREELAGASNIATEEAAMDAGFRGAIGGGSPDRVPGDDRQVAHA